VAVPAPPAAAKGKGNKTQRAASLRVDYYRSVAGLLEGYALATGVGARDDGPPPPLPSPPPSGWGRMEDGISENGISGRPEAGTVDCLTLSALAATSRAHTSMLRRGS
jgi:hypothetical protein